MAILYFILYLPILGTLSMTHGQGSTKETVIKLWYYYIVIDMGANLIEEQNCILITRYYVVMNIINYV